MCTFLGVVEVDETIHGLEIKGYDLWEVQPLRSVEGVILAVPEEELDNQLKRPEVAIEGWC